MTFQYKRVLLVGATSGIGAAMADKLVQEGAKVIAVGRRQERLDAFVRKHGAERASSIQFDITDKAGLDAFVNKVVKDYPDLDSVFLNSGIQGPVRLSKPAEVDLDAFHGQIDTNFTSLVNLSIKFLPHLQAKGYPTSLIVTGTHISLVPAITLSAYSASKAALRAFFDCLRRENQGSNVRFIEISPPMVQSEMHDYIGPDGGAMGMPVDEFTEKTYAELVQDKEDISIGLPGTTSQETWNQLVQARETAFTGLSDLLLLNFAK
ncbi:Serine 3-dehydrogenase [Cladobotryum mycophilum]|uniref:Serine 3-dehydrogenase n=1 Tax=Cladobotryum mycophilum TaxID=491253 RepID=A0ABR0S687_9HYPO